MVFLFLCVFRKSECGLFCNRCLYFFVYLTSASFDEFSLHSLADFFSCFVSDIVQL